jgi:hypothetical protein
VPILRSAAVTDLAAAVEKLAADDAVITDGEMMLGDVESLLDSLTGVQAVLVRRLRTAHQLDLPAELRGRSTKKWLHEEQFLTDADAGRWVRLVNHLPHYPLTQAAFDEQKINREHVAAILTALFHLPVVLRDTIEPLLVEHATQCPPEEIAAFTDDLLEAMGIDKASDVQRERRYAERGVEVGQTIDGNRSVSGTLTPEVGQKLEAALAKAAQPAGPDDTRTPRQRRHDALGEIADRYMAQAEPSFNGAPRTVIVTIDLQVLEDRLRQQWIDMPSGVKLPAATARRLACDAELIPVVLGGKSEVLDIGQAGREFTTAIRRAAYIRDNGTCAFPDCTNHVAEVHHITFRSHGGPNTLNNAAWLCTMHHWLAHEGGWTLQRADHGGYLWTNQLGHQVQRLLSRHT